MTLLALVALGIAIPGAFRLAECLGRWWERGPRR